ncbi:MSP domain-containing protein, partial [Haematococcus lacustris]
PEQGTVEPNKEATIQVVFNKAKELQRELSISSAPDITLAIIEPLTSNKEDIVPIRVSVRAVFSKYAITPARGVNFGPQAYNTTSKPRTFELVNT